MPSYQYPVPIISTLIRISVPLPDYPYRYPLSVPLSIYPYPFPITRPVPIICTTTGCRRCSTAVPTLQRIALHTVRLAATQSYSNAPRSPRASHRASARGGLPYSVSTRDPGCAQPAAPQPPSALHGAPAALGGLVVRAAVLSIGAAPSARLRPAGQLKPAGRQVVMASGVRRRGQIGLTPLRRDSAV